MRSLLFLLALSACAAPRAPASSAADLAPLAEALSCDAEKDWRMSPSGARVPAEAGVDLAVPVSILAPRGETGRFCMATGCESARFVRVPLNRTPDWAARIVTEGGEAGVLTISDNRATFEFTGAGGETIWTGRCAPAGS